MITSDSDGILARLLSRHGIGFRTGGFLRVRRGMDHAKRLSGSEGAPLADPRAVDDEGHGDRDEHGGDAAEEGAGPVDAEGGEHVFGEEGEAGAGEGAEECVCCYG